MMRIPCMRVAATASAMLILGALAGCQSAPVRAPAVATAISGQQISDAYLYLLGRLLVLRQERLDLEKEGFAWNQIVHREQGGVAWANPNLDVVYSEAWVALDEDSCVQLDIPKVEGRYYTWQMLDGRGETLLNINERTYRDKPYGRYALCLKGSSAKVSEGALRVDVPTRTARVLARVELGSDPAGAVRLQHAFTLTPLGRIRVEPFPRVPLFTNQKPPGAEAFDSSDVILNGEPDLNPGMENVRRQVAAVAALAKSSPEGRQRVDDAIEQLALPALRQLLTTRGQRRNGWGDAAVIGNYGSDFKTRTAINLVGIWANGRAEVVPFANRGLDGGATYVQTFPADALPKDKVGYFWSVIAVDARDYRVMPNPLGRYLINKESPLQYNRDGSLTLAYGPTRPQDVPESNWLPTPQGQRYNLTFRFYGAGPDVSGGQYFPPALIRQN